MQCTCCGTALPLTAKFCPECGTAVGIDDTPLRSTTEAVFGINPGDASGDSAPVATPQPAPIDPIFGSTAATAMPANDQPGFDVPADATAAYSQVRSDSDFAPTAAFGVAAASDLDAPAGDESLFGAAAPPRTGPAFAPSPTPGPAEAPTAATESIFGIDATAVQPQFVPTDADKPSWGQPAPRDAAAPAGGWIVPPQAPTTMELPAEAPRDRRLGPALTISAIIAFWLLGTTVAYLFVDANTKNMSRLSNEIFHDVGPLVVGSEAISTKPPPGVWSMLEWVGRYGAWAAAFLLLFAALLRFRVAARILTLVTGLFVGVNATGRAVQLVKSPIWKSEAVRRVDLTRFYLVPIAVTALCAIVLIILAIAARTRRV